MMVSYRYIAASTRLGAGVPRHVHAYWDEVIYVLDGSGFITLNDERMTIEKGRYDLFSRGSLARVREP